MKYQAAPLPHEWMLISIIGFFVSWLYLYNDLGVIYPGVRKWGAAFVLFFIIMFVASVVSMTNATTEDAHLEELAIHEKRKK